MFTGREYDAESRLYYYRARMYHPGIGRFLQTDPIGYADSMNLYAYCLNNPLGFVDPMGLCKDRGFWQKAWEGDYVGTQYGNQALDYYANKIAFGNGNLLQKAGWYTGGFFSALWTPENWKGTAMTLAPSAGVGKWLGRPFYRYVGKTSSSTTTWVTRGWGWKPPYPVTKEGLQQAAKQLHLVDKLGAYRVPGQIVKVPYQTFKPMAGPRLVEGFNGQFTGAVEYFSGQLTFPVP